MELDDLKKHWSEYDKKLSDNLKLNEILLRKINLNGSKREMQKLLVYEFVNIAIGVFLIVYILPNTFYYLNQWRYSIPSFLAIGVTLIGLVFVIIRIKNLLNIDYYGSAVVQVQKKMMSLKRKTLTYRKYELILFPLVVIPLLPILFKMVHNIDIYQDIKLLIFEIILILSIAYPLIFWINKSFYDKKFKNAEKFLSELNEFENEV